MFSGSMDNKQIQGEFRDLLVMSHDRGRLNKAAVTGTGLKEINPVVVVVFN